MKSVRSPLSSIWHICFVLLLVWTFWLSPQKIFAGYNNESPAVGFDNADDGEINHEGFTDSLNKKFQIGEACQIIPVLHLCTEKKEKLQTMYNSSVTGIMASVINGMYMTPPASTYAFFSDFGQTLGFIPKHAYAQGIGFAGFANLLPIWKIFRNVSYVLLSLVMIVIGFMIMFRKKIDPKTVISVQNALPRIIITLLLITFSYAIVGFMIDLMYLVILIVVGLFKTATINGQPLLPAPDAIHQAFGFKTPESLYSQGGLFANMTSVSLNPFRILGIEIFGITDPGTLFGITTALAGILALAGVFFSAAPVVGTGLVAAGGILGLGVPLLYLLLAVAWLFLLIRLIILFTSAYIQVILALIFGPLQILLEAVPGTNSFSSWFKNLLANIAVFPIASVIFMLSNIFNTFAGTATNGNLWVPPFSLGFNAMSISALVSFAILFTIPSIAGGIKEALKAKPAINAGPGVIVGPIGSGVGQIMQLAYQLKFIAPSGGHGGHGGIAETTPYGRFKEGAEKGLK